MSNNLQANALNDALEILRTADEKMIEESGNAVFIRMRKELEDLRARITSARVHCDLLSPILGTRTLPSGRQLVYRVSKPLLHHHDTPLDSEGEEAEKTLIDIDIELPESMK